MKIVELKAAAEAVDVPMYMPERTRDDIQRLMQAWILYHDIANPATILKLIAVAEAVEYSGVAKDCQMIADALKELET
jgi:hypothetical protein